MQTSQITVGIDIGSYQHRVAIAGPDGAILEEFDLAHHKLGFRDFFQRLAVHEKRTGLPVAIAMEGFNGHARPLDTQIRMRGYPLYNVNNLKLARFKEIFPGPAKSDPITVPVAHPFTLSQGCVARSRRNPGRKRPAQTLNTTSPPAGQ